MVRLARATSRIYEGAPHRSYAAAVLDVPAAVVADMVAHCLAALPEEGCGLLVGTGEVVVRAVGTRNAAGSALRYEVDPSEHLAIDRAAGAEGLDVLGAFHSHTHTDAWPSATDVATAVDPSWHWVVISLRQADPVVRSFSIRDGAITEETVRVVEGRRE